MSESFRDLVASVVNRYDAFKEETKKAEAILQKAQDEVQKARIEAQNAKAEAQNAKVEAVEISKKLEATEGVIADTNAVLENAKGLAVDLGATKDTILEVVAQLNVLRETHEALSDELDSFNRFASRLNALDLQNAVKSVLQTDERSIFVFKEVLDELVLTDKFKEVLDKLQGVINSELTRLENGVGGALDSAQSARNEAKILQIKAQRILDEVQKDALKIIYQTHEQAQNESLSIMQRVKDYVDDFYNVLSTTQGRILYTKVITLEAMDNALVEFNKKLEDITAGHFEKLDNKEAQMLEKYDEIKDSIKHMESLNNAIVTGKKYKFRFGIFSALRYIDTANIALMRNDSLMTNAVRFYYENYSKDVLDYLIAERTAFNEAMAEREAEFSTKEADLTDKFTLLVNDIETKRKEMLFLSMIKG